MFKILFKRGTAAENDEYIGKSGTLSIDTDDYTIRVHDGVKKGGHRVPTTAEITQLDAILRSLNVSDVDGLELALASLEVIEKIGVPGGMAVLDSEGTIPAVQLPSFVDDVLEFESLENFPEDGVKGKLYVDIETNLVYRWSDGEYKVIASKPVIADDIVEGQYNLYFLEERVRSAIKGEGDVQYDAETGELKILKSIESVNGQTGDVVIDKSSVQLGNVEDNPVAGEDQLNSLLSDKHMIVSVTMRDVFGKIGITQDEFIGWTLNFGRFQNSTGPGPDEFEYGNEDLGKYGIVSPQDLFTNAEISQLLGMENVGTSLGEDFVWLKFSFANKIIFIPSKPLRHSVSWVDLYSRGLVYGKNSEDDNPFGLNYDQNVILSKPGVGDFKVRIPYSAPTNNTMTEVPNLSGLYDPVFSHGSEWNEIFYRISGSLKEYQDSLGEEDIPPSAPAGEWEQYDDTYLRLGAGNGSKTLTIGYTVSGNDRYVSGRGRIRTDYLEWTSIESATSQNGWRPVLEFYLGFSELFDISSIDYEVLDNSTLNGYVGAPLVDLEAVVERGGGVTEEFSLSGSGVGPIGYAMMVPDQNIYEAVGVSVFKDGMQPLYASSFSIINDELTEFVSNGVFVEYSDDNTVTAEVETIIPLVDSMDFYLDPTMASSGLEIGGNNIKSAVEGVYSVIASDELTGYVSAPALESNVYFYEQTAEVDTLVPIFYSFGYNVSDLTLQTYGVEFSRNTIKGEVEFNSVRVESDELSNYVGGLTFDGDITSLLVNYEVDTVTGIPLAEGVAEGFTIPAYNVNFELPGGLSTVDAIKGYTVNNELAGYVGRAKVEEI